MKQVLIRDGVVVVAEIPAPCVEPGTVLVQVHRSCISTGTELSGIRTSGEALWKRALRHPEKVTFVLRYAATQGLGATKALLQSKQSRYEPTGYSATGVVLEIGTGVDDLRPGDRVGCAGADCAHHAEIIRVPRNLVAPLPQGLGFDEASTVTLGAIALQGVRRANPTLGEAFVVIGLGAIGQLTAQILSANGCRVIGTDLDTRRISLARQLGMDLGLTPDGDLAEQVAQLTDGIGADGVIVTAVSSSDGVISTAFRMCRKKGRVVLIGDVGLNLNRSDFYAKELDFLISTSYGPGRYDRPYENEGLDYPVAYVRWTENRNMAEYLRLVAEGKVRVGPLLGTTRPVDEAPSAYSALLRGDDPPLMAVLSYSPASPDAPPARRVQLRKRINMGKGQVRIAFVGAGSFGKLMLLPLIQTLPSEYRLRAVVSRTGSNAVAVAGQFGADYATTDYDEALNDPDIDAVVIATRHHTHASMALRALERGKHVLVEKPLALEWAELRAIRAFFDQAADRGTPVLLTGFNRRFSPVGRQIKEHIGQRTNPMILNYRMNAGHMPLDHWVHTTEGGGRNRGEACHIYDLFTYLTGGSAMAIEAQALTPSTAYYGRTDNFVATIRFADGSVASLTYTALGSDQHPKEQLDIYVDGTVLVMEDYRQLKIAGALMKGYATRTPDKGHRPELESFARAVREDGEWPIPLWQQIQATEIALRVEDVIRRGAFLPPSADHG